MSSRRAGIIIRKILSVVSITAFLVVAQGFTMNALAAEWELWPKGRATTPEESAAMKAGEAGGKSTSAGISTGTIVKAALIAAAIAGIAIAIGSGGGGGDSSTPAPSHTAP